MKKKMAALGGVATVSVLLIAFTITRCISLSSSMTDEEKAAVARIADKDRAAVQTVATKVVGWNKAKDESVAAFNSNTTAEVAKLKTAMELGDWRTLKGYLNGSVLAIVEAQGAEQAVHAVGNITLTYEPLVVPDMEMPRHDPYITWDEWEPGGWPYAEYVASYNPTFTDNEGRAWLADNFGPKPWGPPESISLKGITDANNEPFVLLISTDGEKLGLGLEGLLSVPGLVDRDSPILNNSGAALAARDAAAQAYLTERLTAWNRAKNAALRAYNATIQSQIDPAKVTTIETALETGDWTTLRPFLEPRFAGELNSMDWYERLRELAGDELRNPGIRLVYEPLEVEDVEIPQPDPAPTMEEWCEAQDCESYPYDQFVKDYEPTFGTDEDAIGLTAESYPIPEPWVPPDTDGTVTLVNPEGWLDLRIPVQLTMVR